LPTIEVERLISRIVYNALRIGLLSRSCYVFGAAIVRFSPVVCDGTIASLVVPAYHFKRDCGWRLYEIF